MHLFVAEILVAAYGCALVTNVIREYVVSGNKSGAEPLPWETIVRQIKYVRVPALRRLANPQKGDTFERSVSSSEMLEAIGGLEGLRRVQHNSIVVAALARRIEDFAVMDDPGLIEVIKGSALQLRRKVLAIVAIRCLGGDGRSVQILLKDVAKLYCQMVSELIELYAITHESRVPRLVAACDGRFALRNNC